MARALSSYGLIEGFTGLRYDAVAKTLSADSKIGDFRGFLCFNGGFGIVEFKDGQLTLDVKEGEIPLKNTIVK